MPKVESTYVVLGGFKEGHVLSIRSLATRVIAVAVRGLWGWRAYVDTVPGTCHVAEAPRVRDTGQHMYRQDAVHLFPQFDPRQYED
jgi:hypothetical protein